VLARYFWAAWAGGAAPPDRFFARTARELRWYCARWPAASLARRARTIAARGVPARLALYRVLRARAGHAELARHYAVCRAKRCTSTCAVCCPGACGVCGGGRAPIRARLGLPV
jgi:hypothetical protein